MTENSATSSLSDEEIDATRRTTRLGLRHMIRSLSKIEAERLEVAKDIAGILNDLKKTTPHLVTVSGRLVDTSYVVECMGSLVEPDENVSVVFTETSDGVRIDVVDDYGFRIAFSVII